MTLTLAVSLLPVGDSDPEIAPHDASSWDVEAYEDLFCWQCGELENFWVDYTIDHSGQLSPDDNQEVEGTYTPPGMHGRMTMCLNCGSFNSDLFPDDVRFGTNLFRLEPCTLEHQLEDVRYESADTAYHEMTATDVVYCVLCGDSRAGGTVAALEQHNFTTEIVAPTCTEGGYTIYTCILCGYCCQEDKIPATGHPFGEWVVDKEPETDCDGLRHRECPVCGEIETELLPWLKPEPEPEPEPKPEPEPEPGPEPEPEPEPEPKPEPEPEPKPIPVPGPEPVPEPAPVSVQHNAYVFGRDDGSFDPSEPLTRAEAAAMLARLLPEKKTIEFHYFSDVPENAWYAPSVERLAVLGVIRGKGNHIFDPGAAMTRAEFAAMTVRFFETIGGRVETHTHLTGFCDVPEEHWAADAIQTAMDMGWLRGDPDGLFRPADPVTRAEGVVILNRVLGHRADRAYITVHLAELRTFADVDPAHWAWYDILEAANSHTAHLKEQELWSR